MKLSIQNLYGREIIDSRGNPTVEAVVELEGALWDAPPSPAAHLRDNLKRWSSATRTLPALAGKAY